MKNAICGVLGMIGGAIASAFGGWSAGLTTLLIVMAIGCLSGLVVAGVFHRSPKSEGGALESRAGGKGLVRKGMTLLIVLIGCRLDIMLGIMYIRDALIIAFIINELLSIIENAGLMGVPIPDTLKDAIELLRQKSSKE